MRSSHRMSALGLLLATWGIAATPALAAPNLAPESSAQLQKLLRVQTSQTAVAEASLQPPRVPADAFDRLFMWNEIALDTTAIDHTPVAAGSTRVFGEQYGPCRASRAMAIVHIAMFDAVNAVTGHYKSYTGVASVSEPVSIDYAIAQAAHDTLVWLYPSQKPRLDAIFAVDVTHIHGSPASIAAGEALGMNAAQAIIALRTNDGSQVPDPVIGQGFNPHGGIGYWSPDPVSKLTVALGAYWGSVKPFVMASGSQFRAPPPPALTDAAYTHAFQQVEILGGDPRHKTPTVRTPQQTFDGVFWSYDGTPSLCAPPRLYNQLARAVALQNGMNQVADAARYLALINTAMADAGVSAWDTKWYYQFWRPVTAIRSHDQGGNTQVVADPIWYPLGGQATNSRGPNFTPPFPAYVSGHATFGGALFEVLRKFWPDNTSFTFVSDEWNGKNHDISGKILPYHPVTFKSFTDAEYANSESRVLIGVHWQFDADMGIAEGNKVGDYVYDHAFQPVVR